VSALIVINVQNDFTPATASKPEGALPVPNGHEVVAVINSLIPRFDLIIATQEWHPANHLAFASQHRGHKVGDVIDLQGLPQLLWPDHGVQETFGAELVADLNRDHIHLTIPLGTDRHIDSYSAFFDSGHRKSTGLAEDLQAARVSNLYLTGLATDACVKNTALDAVLLGLKCYVIEDGCRGLEMQPGDVQRALDEMQSVGVRIIQSSDVAAHV
jgi:nicotinamidase/pyrazinamidase